MANLVDKSGDAYSNIVHGDGTNEVRFRMPGNVPLDVESVVATVDNGAGGATTATLTVRDASGEVIATKRQGDKIPAGDTGTATFALRLTDEGGGIEFDKINQGGSLYIETLVSSITLLALFNASLIAGNTAVIAGNHVIINCRGGDLTITGAIDIVLDTSTVFWQADPQIIVDDNLRIRLTKTARVFEIRDHNNNAIFRVNEDGSLQGKTGKALTFNL